MKTAVKPAVGCSRAGFTFVDASGNLVQLHWADLARRKEALYAFDGTRWKRITSSAAAARLAADDPTLRLAVAPIGSSDVELTARSHGIPASLLAGDGVERVLRARQLLALPLEVVAYSALSRDLPQHEQDALVALRRANPGISDLEILKTLEQYRIGSHEFAVFTSDVTALIASSVPFTSSYLFSDLTPALTEAVADAGVSPADLALLLAHSSASSLGVNAFGVNAHLPTELLELLVEHAAAPDPVCAALASLGIPPGPREAMLASFSLASNGAVTPHVAAALVAELAETGPLPAELLELAGLSLYRSGGDTAAVLELAAQFRADRQAALRTHGSPAMLLADRVPHLSAADRVQVLNLLGVPANSVPTVTDLALVDDLDPELFRRVQELVADAPGGDGPGNLDFVVRAIATFGPRAPEWLLKTCSSPTIDRVRLEQRLPNADATAARVRQLQEVLAAPAPSDDTREHAAASAWLLASLAAPCRDREKAAFLASVADSLDANDGSAQRLLRGIADPAELCSFLAPSAELLARAELTDDDALRRALLAAASSDQQAAASAVRKFLANGGDPSVLLAADAAMLRATAAGLLAPAERAASEAFQAAIAHPGLLLELLPSAAAANKRVKALGDDPAAASERAFLTEYSKLLKAGDTTAAEALARTALADPSLASALLPTAKTVNASASALRELLETPAERQARLDGIAAELAAWTEYCDAVVTGDTAKQYQVAASLFPDRETNRVSVHDGLFWLPSDPRMAAAADGTNFGDWLLAADRGVSALRTENGRRSLSLAASVWAAEGSNQALIKDLADEVLSRAYGGHKDELSLFFSTNKISRDDASNSLKALREFRDVPTPFPLDTVFTDEETGIRGYFLPRTDPRGIHLGVFTDCCQHPGGAGSSCAFTGQTHPSSGFFVVEDASGTILAQSWVWAASGAASSAPGAIFDNIEARIAGRQDGAQAIRNVYDQAADVLADRFGRVLIGAGNDVPTDDLPLLPAEEHLDASSIGYSGYLGDSRSQRLYRTGNPSGVRFTGHADGFVIEDGTSQVFVNADGSVRLDGPDALALAERGLASSTKRTYRVVDADGNPTGAVLDTGTITPLALSVDLDSAPGSYTMIAEELIVRTAERTGLDANAAERWLSLTGGDGMLVARAAAAGITPEEYGYVRYAVPTLGRIPTVPAAITEAAAADPGRETDLRRVFFTVWSSSPAIAEQAFSSPVLVDLLLSSERATRQYGDFDRAAVTTLIEALPLLTATEPAARPALADTLLALRHNSDRSRLDGTGSLKLLQAVETATAAGLSTSEMQKLAILAPEYRARTGSALTDRASVEQYAALTPERRRDVDAVVEHNLRDHSYLHPDLALATALADEPNVSLRHTVMRNLPSSEDPRVLLGYLQQLPVSQDSPYDAVRELAAAVDELEPGSFYAETAHTTALNAVASAYKTASRYVYGDFAGLTNDEVTAIVTTDFDDLTQKADALGLQRSYGENIMPFSFQPRVIRPLAEASLDELRPLADAFSIERSYGSDLGAALVSGLTAEHLARLEHADGERISPRTVSDALDAGLSPAEIQSLATPGTTLDVFHGLLKSSPLREIWAGRTEPALPLDVTRDLVTRLTTANRGSVSAELAGWVVRTAASSPQATQAVRDALDAAIAEGSYSSRGLCASLAEIAGVSKLLGGFGPVERREWSDGVPV